ncbi:hypothetical protein AGMMS49545_12740 [Betaproteobacteria bacterium]|nr:hypothetical protein AGMMS49545_12740 [Betaproteobacteria bacterium]GHU43340.1 hypothetical protein AGMMS50289_09590 [Betaproteobacteria bacterium]
MKKLKALFEQHLFSNTRPLEERTLSVVYLFVVLAILLSSLIRFMTMGDNVTFWVTLSLLPLVIGIYCFITRPRSPYIGNLVLLLILGDIAFPFIFFLGGGTQSGINAYFVLSALLIFLLMQGKPFVYLLTLHVIIVFACYATDYYYPDVVTPLTRGQNFIDNCLSIFVTAFLIAFVIKLRAVIYAREHETIRERNARQESLLYAVNETALHLLNSRKQNFQSSLRTMARCISVDRVCIWQNEVREGKLYYIQKFKWPDKNVSYPRAGQDQSGFSSVETFSFWKDKFKQGECVSGPLKSLSIMEQERLAPYGIKSILVIPVFLQEDFWGFVSFEDCHQERHFTEAEVNILKSGCLLIVNAMQRNHDETLFRRGLEQKALMAEISQILMSKKKLSELINNVLSRTGAFIGASRALIVTNNEADESALLYYSNVSDDLIPDRANNPRVRAVNLFPRFMPPGDFLTFHCNDVHTEADGKYADMATVNVNSFIWVPLYIHNIYWGLLSVEDCSGSRTWDERDIELISSVSGAITGAMMRDLAEQARADANSRIRAMLDTTPLACVLLDNAAHVIDCNLVAPWLFGVRGKDKFFSAYSGLMPELQPDGTNSREEKFRRLRMAFETGYQNFEWMHATAAGNPLPVDVTLVRVKWRNGDYIAAYMRDLRERKADEQKTREVLQHKHAQEIAVHVAHAASEAKSQLLASVSHEIRTPLNALIGMSELMRTDNLDAMQRRYLDDIRRMSHSLLAIINNILDFSRIEAGKMNLIPADYDLLALYEHICALIKFSVSGKPLEFRHSISSDIPPVLFGDKTRIQHIMTNVLGNAVKYTQHGYVELRLEQTAKNGNAYLSITVKDTGIGIKKEDFAKLFERFEQIDAQKNRGISGTGLGLPIVKSLVAMMGGAILMESEYGAGSTFTILLPLVKGNPDNIKKLEASRRVRVSPEVKILVVDDNAINLTVALGYLAQHGIQADTADSGLTALKMVDKTQYDLVFMDHMMPDMDGIETTRRIRALGGRHTGMPIIALSATAIAGARELFLNAGMNDFISKPIDTSELNALLITWLPANKRSFVADTPKETPPSSAPGVSGEAERPVVLDQNAGIARFQNDEEMYRKILAEFREEQQDAIKELRSLLAAHTADKTKVAHRLAHTLKSTAALIGAERLRQTAATLEMALSDGGHHAGKDNTNKQLEMLASEFRLLLEELERIIPAPPDSDKTGSGQDEETGKLDKEKALALLATLEPLLRKGSASCLDLLAESGSALAPIGVEYRKFAASVEALDFPGALTRLPAVRKALAKRTI